MRRSAQQNRDLGWSRLAVIGLAAGLVAAAAGAAGVRVTGTAIELEPPAGFETQERYPGFQHPDSGASIAVTEVPGPYSGVTGGFTSEGLASRGMKLLTLEDLPRGSGPGLLAQIEQPAGGIVWKKWIRAFGDESATTLVVATYPTEAAGVLEAALRHAVLSARPAADAPARDEGLLFRVVESEELVVIHRVGNLLLLAPPGSAIPIPNQVPVLIVGSSIAPATRPSLPDFADRRARQIEQVRELEIATSSPLEVAGMPAHEITARGTDAKTGEPMGIYQLVIDEGGHYHIAIGLVTLSTFGSHLDSFRTVAGSLRLR